MLVVLLGQITVSLNLGKGDLRWNGKEERRGGGVIRKDCGLYIIHVTHRTDSANVQNQNFQ